MQSTTHASTRAAHGRDASSPVFVGVPPSSSPSSCRGCGRLRIVAATNFTGMTDATADAAGEESLGDSYINLLDEPSFVDGPDISLRASLGTIGEDDDVGASQKGEKDMH